MQSHVRAAAAAQLESQLATSLNAESTKLRVPYTSLRSPPRNLRVNKWDAQILDLEILNLLKTPMKSMFSMFEPGVADRVKPEIDAILKAMLFIFTTGIGRPTPGMKLENIRYAPHTLSRLRVTALFLLSVATPYLWKRVSRYLSSARWTARGNISLYDTQIDNPSNRERLSAVMNKVETLVMICQLVNLLAFLRNGTYRSLSERCLRLNLIKDLPSTAPRMINFDYITWQLIWKELMEFGNFLLPLLTWGSYRSNAGSKRRSIISDTRSSQCYLCGISPPQTPYITSCKHVYCYYCLQTAVATEDDFDCVACGNKFDSSRRLQSQKYIIAGSKNHEL